MKFLKTLTTNVASGIKKAVVKAELRSNIVGRTQVVKSKSVGLSSRYANTITESSTIRTEETSEKISDNGIQSTVQQQTTSRVTLGQPGYKYEWR